MSFSIEFSNYLLGEQVISIEEYCNSTGISFERLISRSGFKKTYRTSKEQIDFFSQIKSLNFNPNPGDFVIFVNQSLEQKIPGSVPILFQHLPNTEEVFFIELSDACSGFPRSLLLSDAILMSHSDAAVYIICGEVYSKYFDSFDSSVFPIFSDALSVTKIIKSESITIIDSEISNNFQNWKSISIGNKRAKSKLSMQGAAVLTWSKPIVSQQIKNLCIKNQIKVSELSEIILHQGSRIVIESILESLDCSTRFSSVFSAAEIGNTVSSSIPIHLSMNRMKNGIFLPKGYSTISGFGVGLSSITLLLNHK
jgi:3-oxoacyl-[acyl-carrier-protein] synthase-3